MCTHSCSWTMLSGEPVWLWLIGVFHNLSTTTSRDLFILCLTLVSCVCVIDIVWLYVCCHLIDSVIHRERHNTGIGQCDSHCCVRSIWFSPLCFHLWHGEKESIVCKLYLLILWCVVLLLCVNQSCQFFLGLDSFTHHQSVGFVSCVMCDVCFQCFDSIHHHHHPFFLSNWLKTGFVKDLKLHDNDTLICPI